MPTDNEKKTATKLKGLQVTRVALVDEGANPDAHIRFAKRAEEEPTEVDNHQETQQEAGIVKRIIDVITKAFGLSQTVEKDAKTFSEAQDDQRWDRVASEAYDVSYLFIDSIRSIIYDEEADSSTKEQKMRQSVTEFAAAFESAITNWATGKSASVKAEDKVILAIKRNILKTLQADEDLQQSDPAVPDKTSETKSKGSEKMPTIVKGDNDMKFDTSKMTPEEIKALEDLHKRYGLEEEEVEKKDAPEAKHETAHPATDQANDEVAKSIKAMKAELEVLRKFKTNAEEQELESVAKRYELLGKKPEELVPVLKSLKALGEDQYNAFISIIDASLKAVEESNAFGEIGKRGHGNEINGAWGKIEAAATEIIKSKPGTTWEQAVDIACTTNPELLKSYEESRK